MPANAAQKAMSGVPVEHPQPPVRGVVDALMLASAEATMPASPEGWETEASGPAGLGAQS